MPNVQPLGRTLILETAWNLDLDAEAYRERKAVIDRMVASLEVAAGAGRRAPVVN